MITKKSLISLLTFVACIALSLRFGGSVGEIFRPSILYVTCALLIFGFTMNSVIKTLNGNEFFIFLFFVFYGLITVLWSGAPVYGGTKFGLLLLMNLFFLFASPFFVENFKRVSMYFLVSNILFLGLFYFVFGSPFELISNISGVRLRDEKTSPITYARYLGFASFFIIYLFTSSKNLLFKLGLIGVFFISFLYMFLSGSKGPVFALLAGLFVVVSLYTRGFFKKIIVIGSLVGILSYLVSQLSSVGRAASLILTNRFIESNSFNSRGRLFHEAWDFFVYGDFFSILFGSGSGNFGAQTLGTDDRAYPHNLFFEVLYELGIVGLVLLMIFLINVLAGFKKWSKDRVSIFLLGMFIYTFLNSMVSDDLIGNFLFFGSGLLLGSRKKVVSNSKEISLENRSVEKLVYE